MPLGALVTVPEPDPLGVTDSVSVSVNVAVTDVAAVRGSVQVVAVPEHPPPDQPANSEPDAAAAVRVTCVPEAKLAEHVLPQSIPAGELVTVPEPASSTVSVSVAVNVAVTVVAALSVTVQVAAVPEQPPPDQPANSEPDAAEAVSVI
jgi:hypothetical protein